MPAGPITSTNGGNVTLAANGGFTYTPVSNYFGADSFTYRANDSTATSALATASLTGGSPEPVRVVEVQPGDTLYGIAADLAQPGQIRAMVHRIQELNSLPGGQIVEGQKLAVPKG